MCDKANKGVEAVHGLIQLLYCAKCSPNFNLDITDVFRNNLKNNYDIPRHIAGKDKTSADFNGQYKSKKLIDIEKAKGPVKRKQIVDEHIIPLNISVHHLVDTYGTGPVDYSKLEEDIKYCLETCAVSKDEDKKLTAAGLQYKMPDGWKWGDDKFARYREVGIEALENIKKQDVWTVKTWFDDKVTTEELTKEQVRERFCWEDCQLPPYFYKFDQAFHARTGVDGIVGLAVLKVESKRV